MVDPKTVEVVAPVIGPLCSSLIQHRMSVRETEKMAEKEMEIAEARAQVQEETKQRVQEANVARTKGGRQEAESDDVSGSSTDGNVVMDLVEEEKCAPCKSILREIDDLEGVERERALAEYGMLKERKSDASKEEMRDFLEETEVLGSVFEDLA